MMEVLIGINPWKKWGSLNEIFISVEFWLRWGPITHRIPKEFQRCIMLCQKNISIPIPPKHFWFGPYYPSGNSNFPLYFPLKPFAFETHFSRGFSNDLPWERYECFLEPHIPKLSLMDQFSPYRPPIQLLPSAGGLEHSCRPH